MASLQVGTLASGASTALRRQRGAAPPAPPSRSSAGLGRFPRPLPARRLAANAAAVGTARTAAAATRAAAAAPQPSAAAAAAVDICIEPGPSNSRCIWAGVDIANSAASVYSVLTQYERLHTFIPGLAENRCLERFSDGCRLLQVGQQDLALGLKFCARVLLRIKEHPAGIPPRMLSRSPNSRPGSSSSSRNGSGNGGPGSSAGSGSEGWWPLAPPGFSAPGSGGGWGSTGSMLSSGWTNSSGSGSSSSSGDEDGVFAEWRYLRPRSPLGAAPAMDISFELLEGDFAAFKGLWRIQPAGAAACRLSYTLFVRPQPWLLVGLIERRIQGEIAANLAAVKGHVERSNL